jgi:hypothetical protein
MTSVLLIQLDNQRKNQRQYSTEVQKECYYIICDHGTVFRSTYHQPSLFGDVDVQVYFQIGMKQRCELIFSKE